MPEDNCNILPDGELAGFLENLAATIRNPVPTPKGTKPAASVLKKRNR